MRLHYGAQVAGELPEEGASLANLAVDAVAVLRRHGVVGPSLFDALVDKRPEQAERIAAVKKLWRPTPQSQLQTLVMRRPVPDYPDDRTRRLSDELEAAYMRKRALEERGADATSAFDEILALKRAIREGGHLKAGDSVGDGRYLLLRSIGQGGFSVVWEAYDRESDRQVAVKVLHSQFARDTIRRERFFRGARTMAELEHPAVVSVIEPHGEDSGYHYFVMEHLTGGNLHQAVLEGRHGIDRASPTERLASLVLPIALALSRAHERGLVHRDIKPHNVVLTGSGEPKLTDFDLVHRDDTTGGTRTGAMGSLLYSAPEMLDRPQEADVRADVFGLGMTAIFVLHGAKLTKSKVRDVTELIASLPCDDSIRRALSRAVEWEVENRFATSTGSATRSCRNRRPPSLNLRKPAVRHRGNARQEPWC